MRYRAGFRYQQTHININGDQIGEYGINFGVGIPLMKSSPYSSVNIGFEVGERGKEATGLVREQYTALTVGVTLAPRPLYDRWFYKRKID